MEKLDERGNREANQDDRACSIQDSLDSLGDRWTILIMRDAFRGVRRFDDFRRDLDIARPVLTERLKRLVVAGVLDRRLYCERPPATSTGSPRWVRRCRRRWLP